MTITAGELRTQIEDEYGSDVPFTKIKEALELSGRVGRSTSIDDSNAVKKVAKHLNLKKLKGSRAATPETPVAAEPATADQASSASGITARKMADLVSTRTKPFTMSVKDVGQAIGRPRLKDSDAVAETVDVVLERLLELKPALASAIEGFPQGDEDDLIGSELVRYEANPFDEQLRLQVQAMIDNYRLVVEKLGDKPYRPRIKASKSGTGYNFPNPFTGREDYMSQEKYRPLKEDRKRSFPMDTRPLKEAMAALVFQMSSVTHTCFDCLDPIFDDEVAIDDKKMGLLLAGTFFLPGTPDVPRDKIIGFTGYCGVCKDIRREVVKMEVEVQEMSGRKAQAKRTQFYVDKTVAIFDRHVGRREHLTPLVVGQRLRTVAEGRETHD